MNHPHLPHEEPTDADAKAARDAQEAEHAAVISTQFRILFILLIAMAACFTLAWEGLQSAISQIH